jgi:hypothetical protein
LFFVSLAGRYLPWNFRREMDFWDLFKVQFFCNLKRNLVYLRIRARGKAAGLEFICRQNSAKFSLNFGKQESFKEKLSFPCQTRKIFLLGLGERGKESATPCRCRTERFSNQLTESHILDFINGIVLEKR